MLRKKQSVIAAVWVIATSLLVTGAGWSAEAPFFQGKTLTILEGRAAGGTGSLRVQGAVKYLQKYLPGNPTVVYRYMSGAGGVAAVNYLVNADKPDGLTIGSVSSGIVASEIVGASAVRFKLDDLVFLGSGSAGNPAAVVIRPGLKLDSVEKLRAYKGLRFANRSVGHTQYIRDRLTAFILELTEPRWILGYGDDEVRLSLERGEADAMFGGIPGLLRESPHWFQQGYTVPVVFRSMKGQGAERYPNFPQGSPTVDQFADTELKRAVLRLYNNSRPGTTVFFVPKGVPEPALKALKGAFDKVWQDPQFVKESEAIVGEPADPLTGDEIHRALREIPKDPKIMEIYKQLIGAGPLPPSR